MPSQKPGTPAKASKIVLPPAPLSKERDRLLTVRVSDHDLRMFRRVSKELDLNMTSLVRFLVHREDERIAEKRRALRGGT
jgi:hypothetical protein